MSEQTSLAFMASPITAWAFTLFACTELVLDKLPFTPSRLGAVPLGARILSGALCAATVCAATHQPVAIGAVAGIIGAVTGALAGYHARRHLTMNREGSRSARRSRRGCDRDRHRGVGRHANLNRSTHQNVGELRRLVEDRLGKGTERHDPALLGPCPGDGRRHELLARPGAASAPHRPRCGR